MKRVRKKSSQKKRRRIVVTDTVDPGVAVAAASSTSRNLPVRPGNSGNNFYIFPREIFDFLSQHPELYEDDDWLNLDKVRDVLIRLESGTHKYEKFWRGKRDDPNFLKNEYLKMHAKTADAKKSGWMFPRV